MHELGIVTHVAKTVEQIALENDITEVSSVVLQIGEVSGIVEDLYCDCWNYFRVRNDILKNAELVIETIPAVTYCSDCRRTYKTVQYGRICPYCGSENTWLQQGNETLIKEITVPEEEE